MKHILVHLIQGEAKRAHEAITADLAEKFDSFPLHERIPPHLTLKRWFEPDQKMLATLDGVLSKFASDHEQSDYSLKGFGHFGADVIYVDVDPAPEVSQTVRELMQALRDVEGMTFDEFDEEEDDLHATVAMGALKPFDFDKLWEYLNSGEQPNFAMKFDNIALMRREEDKWEVVKIWKLKP